MADPLGRDRLFCWLGLHRPTVSVYGEDGPDRLKLTVRIRCAWGCADLETEDSLSIDKRGLQGVCGVLSMGGMGCQKPSQHAGGHYHPAYGEWPTASAPTIPAPVTPPRTRKRRSP